MASPSSQRETKVCVIVDSRTPVIIKVPVSPNQITLANLKTSLPAIDQPNYKYFFKSNDSEFGIVKEEIQEDSCLLPCYKNRVVAWVLTPSQANDELASSKNGTFKTLSEMTSDTNYNSNYGVNSLRPLGTTTGTTITTSYDDGMSSIMTTDLESTSYFTETEDDSVSCSDYSQTTCDTFISQRKNPRHKTTQNGRQLTNYEALGNSLYRNGTHSNHHHHNNISNGYNQRLSNINNISSSSSTTTSSNSTSATSNSGSTYSNATAVQCITVHLVLTNENFLGLHIYANAINGVDEGIYVDGVTDNSAVAQDGRIEPGDKLIQVNETNLEELTNDEAVKVLKDAVIKRGPLKLVVAKFIESNNNKNDPIAGLKDAVQPIDTAAWVAHATSQTQTLIQQQDRHAHSTNSSPSFGSANAQDTDCIRPASTGMRGLMLGSGLRLNRITTEMKDIIQHMQVPKFGVELKDREWLKIQIPRAFLGSDLVSWLERNVCGFANQREAKKFASRMLKEGHIIDPISKKSFSSKSYYTFAASGMLS